jgi:hypothetical protein
MYSKTDLISMNLLHSHYDDLCLVQNDKGSDVLVFISLFLVRFGWNKNFK